MPIIDIPDQEFAAQLPKRVCSKKLVYVDPDGNEVDISDYFLAGQCESRDLKYGIGAFTIELDNNEARFNDILTQGTEIRLYADHVESSPSNRIFKGKIDDPLPGLEATGAWVLEISGRDYPELADDRETFNFSNSQADSAFSAVVSDMFSGVITADNLAASMTTSISQPYQDRTGVDMFSDILKQSSHSAYIDYSTDDVTSFADGAARNQDEKILHGVNLMPFRGVGKRYSNEVNKLIGYGGKKGNLLLMKTVQDTSSQANSWKKAEVITESSQTTVTQLSGKLKSELSFRGQVPYTGSLTAAGGLPTLKPGQAIRCVAQYAGLDDWFSVSSFMHVFDREGSWYTICEISRVQYPPTREIKILDRTVANNSGKNVNSMDETVFYFDFSSQEDISTLSNLSVEGESVSIDSGQSSGTLATVSRTVDNTPQSFEFRAEGEDLGNSVMRLSTDSGQTFTSEHNLQSKKNSEISLSNAGKTLVAEIILRSNVDNPAPRLQGFNVAIKHSGA